MPHTTAREKLLDAARDQILSRGFPATRVDEICRRAGVSKGSFYHCFRTKDEIGLAVLDGYYDRLVRRLSSGTYIHIEDPAERACGFLDHVVAVSPELWKNGCLLGVFAMDLAEVDPGIRARVGEMFDGMARGLVRLFRPMVESGEGGESAERAAEHFLAVLQGSILVARAHGDPDRIVKGVRSFRRYLGCP
jgi:TetR/AcrR family transcriptional repressor of nem operon